MLEIESWSAQMRQATKRKAVSGFLLAAEAVGRRSCLARMSSHHSLHLVVEKESYDLRCHRGMAVSNVAYHRKDCSQRYCTSVALARLDDLVDMQLGVPEAEVEARIQYHRPVELETELAWSDVRMKRRYHLAVAKELEMARAMSVRIEDRVFHPCM